MLELAPVGERVADVEDEGKGGAGDHYGGDDEVDDVARPTWLYLLGWVRDEPWEWVVRDHLIDLHFQLNAIRDI